MVWRGPGFPRPSQGVRGAVWGGFALQIRGVQRRPWEGQGCAIYSDG